MIYRKTSNIRLTLAGNKIVDHSDVVGASPVGAAPTTSSFSTSYLASRDSAKTATRKYKNLLSVAIWCDLYEILDGNQANDRSQLIGMDDEMWKSLSILIGDSTAGLNECLSPAEFDCGSMTFKSLKTSGDKLLYNTWSTLVRESVWGSQADLLSIWPLGSNTVNFESVWKC